MNSSKHSLARWALLLLAGAVWAGLWQRVAQAADSTASSPQTVGQETKLEEILVTAAKRTERLQDVPASVSALSGATLQDMGATDFTDYARSIPGLTFTDAGAGRQTLAIRGVNPSAATAGTVGYYIDETPIPGMEGNGTALNPSLVDIDRIEVLRGPQGTLYGSSSIGGTIKLIPNAPNLSRVEGSVKGEALVTQGADGASPGGRGEFVLNVPIVEGIAAVRAAFWYYDVGGFINRTWTNAGANGIATGPVVGTVGNLPDEHTWGGRVTALFQPTEQLKVTAMIYSERQHFDGFNDITGGTNNPSNQLVQSFISDTAEPQVNRFDLFNLTVKYNFGRFNLVSSTSYLQRGQSTSEEATSLVQLIPTFYGQPAFSGALANIGIFNQSVYNFSQEARLATTERIAGFDGVLGVFYSDAHDPRNYTYYPPQYNELVAGNDPTNPVYAPDGNVYSAWGPGYSERQIAGFGELTYHFTDALTLTGGIRHYDVSNRFQLNQSGLLIGGNVPGVISVTDTSSSAQGNVYKGNLSYKLTPDHLLYAQYSEGFRPGFGNTPLPPECNSEYTLEVKPDSIKSYELGAKTDWLDRRLTVNAAAYRINWTDIQQGLLLPCGFGIANNYGSAVIKGGELESSAQLTHRVNVGFTVTYLHTELLQADAASGALPGDPIEYVPNWQYALYAQTTFPLRQADDGFARLDYQYTGSSITNYTRLANGSFDPAYEVQVVRLLNARIGERYHAWEFAFQGTNLLNNVVRQSIDPNAAITIAIPGRPRYVMTRPRTFSLSATLQF
jgi:outer membrane receptor protein involved in Fe transport